jgi:hypothetical protein
VLAQPIRAGGFELEGNQLHAIEVGHTDTDDTTGPLQSAGYGGRNTLRFAGKKG